MSTPNWIPTFDKVLVQRAETVTRQGRIDVPDAAQQPQAHGTVVAAGPGRLNTFSGLLIPNSLLVGSEVLFSPFAGIPVPDHDDFLILREDEVLAWRAPAVAVEVDPPQPEPPHVD